MLLEPLWSNFVFTSAKEKDADIFIHLPQSGEYEII